MPLVFPNPPLSHAAAYVFSTLVSISYVGSIYISQLLRPSPYPRSRDDPKVIQARLFAASLSTIACCAVVLWIMWVLVPVDVEPALRIAFDSTLARLGLPFPFSPSLTVSTLKPYLVMPLLFLGPLYVHFLDSTLPLQSNWSFKLDVLQLIFNWQGIRNFIVGPITEEVTYRACVCSLLHLAGFSKRSMIIIGPFWFGLAHVHHAYETYKQYGRTPAALRRAVISSCFQFVYTTVFGWYCTYVFLRTGSLAVPTISHIFCNVMGMPGIGSELREHPSHKTSIMVSYISGIVLFSFTLVPWTSTEDGFVTDNFEGVQATTSYKH